MGAAPRKRKATEGGGGGRSRDAMKHIELVRTSCSLSSWDQTTSPLLVTDDLYADLGAPQTGHFQVSGRRAKATPFPSLAASYLKGHHGSHPQREVGCGASNQQGRTVVVVEGGCSASDEEAEDAS